MYVISFDLKENFRVNSYQSYGALDNVAPPSDHIGHYKTTEFACDLFKWLWKETMLFHDLTCSGSEFQR